MHIKSSDSVEKAPVAAGEKTTKQVLIGPDEGPNFAMRRFTIESGGGMPLHTNTVEHEQYILKGQAHIRIGDQEYDVQKGDVVFIPAGVKHSYNSYGTEDFAFLCIVPNLKDTIELVSQE